MAEYAAGADPSPDGYIATLNAIASGMLIRLFFWASQGSERYDRLLEGYQKLGPYGLVWNIGPPQIEAFTEIRDRLQEDAVNPEHVGSGCILGRLCDEGVLDETLLGNLIYMVEMGRYDTYSLFRWLTKYAAEHPECLERIAHEAGLPGGEGRSFTEAFVLETLRMDQSERLLRKIGKDFVFDGQLFPKGATLRICLWESHKSPEVFPEPLRFKPERFLGADPGSDEFAPFGLDRHQCPLGDIAIRTAMLFVRKLATGYEVLPSGDGLPVRGAYHWEPASRFSVRLRHRTNPS
ncbi:MAG: cytochrome P450, partial [Verrucomicrobiales bacterium]|nr:cytochrome P450 [Verrucomicrobiales bacterium]